MKEIEAKFRIADKSYTQNLLHKIGAVNLKTIEQIDTYFKHSKVGYLIGQPTYLRVRSTDDKSYIAFHYKHEKYIWEEIETQVDDAKKMKDIFGLLSFEIDVEVIKKRIVYNYQDSEIVIDDVKGLGFFLEIESPSIEQLKRISVLLELDLSAHGHLLEGISYADMIRFQKNN